MNNEQLLKANKKLRMNSLYHIVDKKGDSIKFKLNPVQEYVLDNIHKRNLIFLQLFEVSISFE